jgi:predicted methyltransferase
MHSKTHTKFLDPESVMFLAGLKPNQTVTDFGAGSGYYALAAAKIVGHNGMVNVVDIKEESLDHLSGEARMRGYKQIKTYQMDLDLPKLSKQIPVGYSDMVVLANILHEITVPENLLAHSYAMLKTGGLLLVVDWNDQPGPIGPPAEKRLHPSNVKKQIESCSLKYIKDIPTDAFHFAMVFEK